MLVEEAPSISAGRARRHLYTRRGPSKAYRLLDRVLRRALGVGLEQAYLTSLVKCPAPGMGEPREDQLSACRPFLDEEQRMVAPRLLIALGRNVSRRLVDPGISSIGRGRGVLVRRLDGVLVVSTYHPAYALGRGLEEEMVEDLARAARELGAASGQTG
jgi:uracil-DNA glycosylase family 4